MKTVFHVKHSKRTGGKVHGGAARPGRGLKAAKVQNLKPRGAYPVSGYEPPTQNDCAGRHNKGA